MDILYHRTSALLEEVHRLFGRLERSPPDQCLTLEAEIQSLLNQIGDGCDRMEVLVNKEVPSRRVSARVQLDQLKYDMRHFATALSSAAQRREQREREAQEREALLATRFERHPATAITIDPSLQQHERLRGAHRGVDDLLGSGASVLGSLREQKSTLKGAHKRILDVANTLGLSNTVMRFIEKRAYQDKYILFGGMIFTCVIMVMVVKYLT